MKLFVEHAQLCTNYNGPEEKLPKAGQTYLDQAHNEWFIQGTSKKIVLDDPAWTVTISSSRIYDLKLPLVLRRKYSPKEITEARSVLKDLGFDYVGFDGESLTVKREEVKGDIPSEVDGLPVSVLYD